MKESPGLDTAQMNSTKHLEKGKHLSFSKYSKKLQRKGHFLTHSMKPVALWYQNQMKISQKITGQYNW